MPGKNVIGQCSNCCDCCPEVWNFPATIYASFSGLTDEPGGYFSGVGSLNGNFALTQSSPGVWQNTSIGSITYQGQDDQGNPATISIAIGVELTSDSQFLPCMVGIYMSAFNNGGFSSPGVFGAGVDPCHPFASLTGYSGIGANSAVVTVTLST